jgi:ketosteroid isomerase-like protein
MRDFEAWSNDWPYGMARGEHMRIKLRDCQVSGDSVTCTVGSITDCFQMDVIETLTVKDGKITQLLHRSTPEEDAKWEAYSGDLTKWAQSQDLEEARVWLSEDAKGVYGYDWGVALEALCKMYEAAKTQPQDDTGVVEAWLAALNNGELDAALALMASDATIPAWGPVRNTLGWWIDIKMHYGPPACLQKDQQLVCDFIMTDDGCIKASGDVDGIPVRYGFSFQDGKITNVDVEVVDWEDYGAWLQLEEPWAQANRAEEWAKIDFATWSGGEVAIKLCQEYATFAQEQTQRAVAAARAFAEAINAANVDKALDLFADDTVFKVWTDEATGSDEMRSLFDWLTGKGTAYQIGDCQWIGQGSKCEVSVVDGCTAAFGAPDGLPLTMTFYLREDGKLQRISGAMLPAGRKSYGDWFDAATAWASANRSEEAAQAEGYSKEAGTMAVKLCQDYAETLR